LQKEAVALYAKNVSGFYDPHDHVLYLLKDQPPSMQRMVIAHELAHAIQDEKLGLEQAVRASAGSEDAQMALAAAFEGNAQAVAAAGVGFGKGAGGGGPSRLLPHGVGGGGARVAPWRGG